MQGPQVNFIKQAVIQVGPLPQLSRDILEGGNHPAAFLAPDHDHHVIIVAEFLDILLPALIVGFILAVQVVTLVLVRQVAVGIPKAEAARKRRAHEHQPGKSKPHMRHGGQHTGNKPRVFLFHVHAFPVPRHPRSRPRFL